MNRRLLIVNKQNKTFAWLNTEPRNSLEYEKTYEKFRKANKGSSAHAFIAKVYEDQMENGIYYTYYLCRDGMLACFIALPGQTLKQITTAKRDLKNNNDVVSVTAIKLETEIKLEG